MKLTELFTSDKQVIGNGKMQTDAAKNDVVNRQIRSLIPGQTLQGEVLGKIGNEVQIRVAEDFVLLARLEQSMNLDIGKLMTFEVKNNGKALTLSPLFTNVATDANVLKALDMASLPVNDTTVSIAKQLMAAGLSIDRNTLQQVYREVNQFSQNEVLDIVNLHKLQMPVNETNVIQMASYRNLTHQLMNGMNHVLDAVPKLFSEMMHSGNTEGAVKLYQQLVLMAKEAPMAEEAIVISPVQNTEGATVTNPIQNTEGAVLNDFFAQEMTKAVITESAVTHTVITAGMRETVGKEASFQTEQTVSVTQQLSDLLGRIAAGDDGHEMLEQLNQIWKESGGDKECMKPLLQLIKNQLTITPEEVAEGGKVEQLYDKLNRQLKGLAQTMESLGQTSSTAYKAVANMTQNLDFMQQINQMYTYVQLPLRLQQGEAHGDLYVYSNKKHLAANDGQISALLHLDMEHLGPVDVYVSMKQSNVKTQFYLKDDELLDFLMEHIDILTERLQKRGYSCECEMQVRQQEDGQNSSIKKLLQQEHHVPLAEYAFDVRT